MVSLRELTLEGEIDKVDIAIKRLQAFEPPEGYYLAFSGGKDSIVILDLAKQAGVKFDAHYHMTTVDPPELVRFIRTFPEVHLDKPAMSMWQLIRHKGMLPTRHARYCCEVLKEGGGRGRRIVTGIRWAESSRRSKRQQVENCMRGGRKTFVNPILEWTDEDVWEYIKFRSLAYCSLYDEGFSRLGCVLCPLAGPEAQAREAIRWPKIAAAYRRVAIESFPTMVAKMEARGETCRWESGEEYFAWWLANKSLGNRDQLDLGIYE